MKAHRFIMTRISRSLLLRLAVAAGMALPVSTAAGQGGPGSGIDRVMQPDYLQRDLPILSEGLGLDETQKLIIKEFFDVYQEDVSAAVEWFKDALIPQVTGPNPPTQDQVTRIVFGLVEEMAAKKKKLTNALVNDIKTQVLSEEQVAMWPSVERQLTRVKSLGSGRLSGENVDLVLEVGNLDLVPALREPIQPTLEQYAIALDTAIKQRDEAIDASRGLAPSALQDSDHAAYLKAIDELIKRRVALRHVNEQYLEALASMLPADEAAALRTGVLEKAYPNVMRTLSAERMILAAQEIPDLPADVLLAVVDLEHAFRAELAMVNQTLIQTIRTAEPEQEMMKAEQHIARMAARSAGEAPKRDHRPHEAIRNAFDQREAMNNKYIQMLQELLSPEQFGSLPGNKMPGATPEGNVVQPPGGGGKGGEKPSFNSGGTREGGRGTGTGRERPPIREQP